MVILIHSSKTMHVVPTSTTHVPEKLKEASELSTYMQTLSVADLAIAMKLSTKLATETFNTIQKWSLPSSPESRTIDSFAGDIYSGLQTHTWKKSDEEYAQKTLRILSGLYGILKPLDTIRPYRLEMACKLPTENYNNLYKFWGDTVAQTLPDTGTIVNLAAAEYSKLITPYIQKDRIITPRFLTIHSETKKPTFVVVHAKIARGSYANWLIKNRITDNHQLTDFTELGYALSPELSTKLEPVFVCQTFEGLGLSVRLREIASDKV